MNYLKLYTYFLKRFIKVKRPIRVVFDCSNGTTGIILKKLFQKSNVKGPAEGEARQGRQMSIVFINDKPDGNFPAHGPNPLAKGATRQLEQEVKKQKADLGVIFDADGDRAFFVDGRGRFMDGDIVTRILIEELRIKKVVVDINTGWLIKKSKRLEIITSRTGTFFMKEAMRKFKAVFGAERSGHYYFKKFFNADSGILTAILFMNRVSRMKKGELADYIDWLPKYYRHSVDFHFDEKRKKEVMDNIEKKYSAEGGSAFGGKNKAIKLNKLDGLTVEFGDWWFNLRPSNTEPLLRLNIEVNNFKILKEKLREINKIILS